MKKILMILLNIQEKIWLKKLDNLIFYCDETEQRKANLRIVEDKLRNLLKFRSSLCVEYIK